MNYKWFTADEAWDLVMVNDYTLTNAYDWDWPRFSRCSDGVNKSYPDEEGVMEVYKNKEEFLKDVGDETFRII
jgi:hypothetical protein